MNDIGLELSVREARDADAAAISRLLDALGHPLDPPCVIEQLRALEAQGGSSTWVAEREGRVVGLVSAQTILMLHRPAPTGRVTVLVVAPDTHGHGIGTALLRAAERFLFGRGCKTIEVTSAPHRTAAHAFYLRRGFARQPERFLKRSE